MSDLIGGVSTEFLEALLGADISIRAWDDAMMILDDEGMITAWSKSGEKLFSERCHARSVDATRLIEEMVMLAWARQDELRSDQ